MLAKRLSLHELVLLGCAWKQLCVFCIKGDFFCLVWLHGSCCEIQEAVMFLSLGLLPDPDSRHHFCWLRQSNLSGLVRFWENVPILEMGSLERKCPL